MSITRTIGTIILVFSTFMLWMIVDPTTIKEIIPVAIVIIVITVFIFNPIITWLDKE